MATYSMDLRARVVAACDEGILTREEIAEAFCVSTAWIRRLLQRRRDRGSYAPLNGRRGRRPAFSGAALGRLERLIAAQPDATLKELRDRSGVSCSVVTVFNTLNRLGYRLKKRRSGRRSRIDRTWRDSAAHGDEKRLA
jgi:transposase